MARTKEKKKLLEKFGRRKFDGQIFLLANIVEYKKQAKRNASQRRARGFKVRVVLINDDYAIYVRKKK